MNWWRNREWARALIQGTSASRRVDRQGDGRKGLELTLAPLASITGRTVLDAAPKDSCEEERSSTLLETVITALRDEKRQEKEHIVYAFLYERSCAGRAGRLHDSQPRGPEATA